ncbi:hypothetical protein PAXINDRAFT_17515 [Paxillus involutus ATCC 200175]|uniref:HMG box domain-containing protein n=1 Tax=Paxillus involutus ATCC 200175 TaxID=664439 RepID=A0A0C9SQ34_PAXIN|nr:hypothetical protein PAXINDRAFT_17515 [Paxillus involutus ATCC 200175]
MTTTLVHGWSPQGGGDEDVYVSQDMCFMTTIKPLPLSNGALLSSTCPPLDTKLKTRPSLPSLPHPSQPIQSTPLSCFPRFPMAPSSDRRAQRNRSRDPSWIPRPRNAFIIFRCEYSREHTQSVQGQEDDNFTNPTAKTLSKRAAEAWKQISPAEKDRYKLLADREREEHARLYPSYRFRPMRRRASGTKKTFYEHPQGSTGSMEHIIEPSTPFPSVLAHATQHLEDEAQRDPPSRPRSRQGTSEILSHRRSSSDTAAESFPMPPVLPSHHRDRRANSMVERAQVPIIPPAWHATATPFVEMSSYSLSLKREGITWVNPDNTRVIPAGFAKTNLLPVPDPGQN